MFVAYKGQGQADDDLQKLRLLEPNQSQVYTLSYEWKFPSESIVNALRLFERSVFEIIHGNNDWPKFCAPLSIANNNGKVSPGVNYAYR